MTERGPKNQRGAAGEAALAIVLGLSVFGIGYGAARITDHGSSEASAPSVEPTAPSRTHTAPKPKPSPRASKIPNVLESSTPTFVPTSTPTSKPTPTPPPKVTSTHDTSKAPLIVLDPGHDGIPKPIYTRDKATGLMMTQYANHPEIDEVFEVAREVEAKLKAAGYRVMLTKSTADGSATLRQRAEKAIQNDADLEVMIHDDHTQKPSELQWVTPQAIGGYRSGTKGKIICQNPKVVRESRLAAEAIAKARTAAMPKYPAVLHPITFYNRGPKFAYGNLPEIQLFDCIDENPVPAVYSETGAKTGSSPYTRAPESMLDAYAKGLVKGIENAVPIN